MKLDELDWIPTFHGGRFASLYRIYRAGSIWQDIDGSYSIYVFGEKWCHLDACSAQCVLYYMLERHAEPQKGSVLGAAETLTSAAPVTSEVTP
ncbi:MAG: hypothetical protein ACXWQR_14180 [Ktedonobacterales bacterium]